MICSDARGGRERERASWRGEIQAELLNGDKETNVLCRARLRIKPNVGSGVFLLFSSSSCLGVAKRLPASYEPSVNLTKAISRFNEKDSKQGRSAINAF